jgi:hypothetical protein
MIWKLFSEEKPEQYTKIIIHRVIGKQSYVDVINYFEEPETKLAPLNNIIGINIGCLYQKPLKILNI